MPACRGGWAPWSCLLRDLQVLRRSTGAPSPDAHDTEARKVQRGVSRCVRMRPCTCMCPAGTCKAHMQLVWQQ